MTITLAQAKVGMADKVDQMVIDEFRRASVLLDILEFDNIISPQGGSTLTYGYVKLRTPSVSAIRALNTEYTAGEAIREEKTTKAVIMGGSFQLDRVIIDTAGVVDELAFQLQQKVKATVNQFHYLVVNGDVQATVPEFDGLKNLLAGSSTEKLSAVDISTSANRDANYNAFLDEVDEFLSLLAQKPSALLMNTKMLSAMRSVARRAGYYTRSENAFGVAVEYYNGIPMLDMGQYYNGSALVDTIPTVAGKTALYAVCIARNGFHGISVQGDKIVKTYLPDMARPGAVKTGEVEFIAGVALKDTKMAGVLKDIAIAPAV